MTGAEIDRPAHLASALFAAQASEEFRKGEIAAPLGKQAHGVNGLSLAAMQLQEAVGPVKQAMIWEEAGWVHPPIFHENKTRTIAKADVAEDLKLWTAKGAGGISRQVLGTVVIGGMLAASLLAIFFIPVSFVVIEKLGHWLGLGEKPEPKPAEDAKGAHA